MVFGKSCSKHFVSSVGGRCLKLAKPLLVAFIRKVTKPTLSLTLSLLIWLRNTLGPIKTSSELSASLVLIDRCLKAMEGKWLILMWGEGVNIFLIKFELLSCATNLWQGGGRCQYLFFSKYYFMSISWQVAHQTFDKVGSGWKSKRSVALGFARGKDWPTSQTSACQGRTHKKSKTCKVQKFVHQTFDLFD